MRESIGLSEDQPSRARRYAPDAVFVILTLVVIAIRAKALANGGAPPGFDGGDWLAVGHGLFGNAVRPSGATAAPFVPALVALSVSIVGRQAAFVGAGALCSVIPGIGAYIALRRFSPGVGATLLGGLALAAAWVGEPASWGGYPQLVAIGLLPIVVMTADHAIAHLSYRAALGGGLALLLVALTSDFVFAMTLSGTVMVVALGFLQGRAQRRRLLAVGSMLVAPLVFAVPLYLKIASARIEAVTRPAMLLRRATPSLAARVDGLWFDAPIVWRATALVGLAAIPLLWNRRREAHWRVAVAIVIPALVAVVLWPEPRLVYFVPPGVVIAAGLWNRESPRIARIEVTTVLLVVGLLVQLVALPSTARLQARRYQVLTPRLVAALDFLRTSTDRASLVVVTPFRNAPPLGWWTEGLAERRTLSASSEDWVYFPRERINAARAARVLSAGVPTQQTLAVARRFGVDFVLIDKRWNEYRSARVINLSTERPGVVAYENSAAVVLRTGTVRSNRPGS